MHPAAMVRSQDFLIPILLPCSMRPRSHDSRRRRAAWCGEWSGLGGARSRSRTVPGAGALPVQSRQRCAVAVAFEFLFELSRRQLAVAGARDVIVLLDQMGLQLGKAPLLVRARCRNLINFVRQRRESGGGDGGGRSGALRLLDYGLRRIYQTHTSW